ncbi:MAG: hypothetical protein KA444_01225 [Bacteroidia bacterium]|nr:hypothetical protein [Bacteroidia bacterium]
MRKEILFVLLFISQLRPLVLISAPSPVLLFLSRQDQVDTVGYNLVNELPVLVYREIMSGRVPLWDSPEKSIQIKPTSLKRLEESSGDEFIHAKQLFIYELWDLDKKKGDLQTVGFFFSSRTPRGEEVSYGFVEYVLMDSLLRSTLIPLNSNGNCDLTFHEVLKSKYYFYNIVQIGEKKITNIKEAIALKEDVKGFVNQHTIPVVHDCKYIRYSIEPNDSIQEESRLKSNLFIQSLQLYLNENREVFYNLGGDRIRNFIQPYKITITRIEVEEKWRKVQDAILYELLSIKVFAENQPLDIISLTDIHVLDFITDFKAVQDFLMEKEFYFRIVKVNNQEIVEAQSEAYLKGLHTWKWNQLSEFVRYE